MGRLQTRTLGEITIPRLVLGTMAYGIHRGRAQQVATIRAALAAGMLAIDTAPLYNFGRTESVLGEALEGHPEALVLGKVVVRWDDDARGEVLLRTQIAGKARVARKDARPCSVRKDVEQSLRRLGRERLDLCQLHHPDVQTPIAETIGELLRLRDEGKIGAIGVSNMSPAQLHAAKDALGDVPLSSQQLEYSLLAPHGRAGLEAAKALGVGTLVYSPLQRGALVGGAAQRARLHLQDPRRGRLPFVHANARRIDAAIEESVAPIARRTGNSVAQVVLAWLLHQPYVDALIVGASSPEQVAATAAAASLSLPSEDIRRIAWTFAGVALDPDAKPRLRERAEAKARRVAGAVLRRVGRLANLLR